MEPKCFLPLLKLMDILGVVRFVQGAVSTNLFGLGCPFYCTPPSLSLLALCFIAGVLTGVGGCAWISYRLGFLSLPPFPCSPPSAAPVGLGRLKAYARRL